MFRIPFPISIMISVLLVAAAGTASADDVSCQALHEAVFMDEPAEVMGLIRNGVDVNCLDQLRHTPIITATTGASLESFVILLRHGAKLNVRDEWGMSLIKRIQDKIHEYEAMKGGDAYRRIYERMAALVAENDVAN